MTHQTVFFKQKLTSSGLQALADDISDDNVSHNHRGVGSTGQRITASGVEPDGVKHWAISSGAVTPVKTGSFSHVFAESNSGQSIPNGAVTTYIYEDEIEDALEEYNPATGIFTTKEAGFFSVRAALLYTGTTTWAAGEEVSLAVYTTSDSIQLDRDTEHTATNKYAFVGGSCVVYLEVGQTIQIRTKQSSGAALAVHSDASFNYLMIDRLPN